MADKTRSAQSPSQRAIRKGKAIIASDFEVADSIFQRARGLMFRGKPITILFKFDYSGRHSIHSLFVFFKFDAVYLDENKRVVDCYSEVMPFLPLLVPKASALYLVEFPPGTAKSHGIKIGDRLDFEL